MPRSISFDRAATFYDATRKLPEDAAFAITNGLLTEIRNAGTDSVLEVGVGTGRISRPLMAAGIHVTGVDISAQMMAQLLAQLGPEHTPPNLLLGDATRLPLRDGSFRAAIVVHVFHLVASAAAAIAEIRRALVPGGVLLHQSSRPSAETMRHWEEHKAFWDGLGVELGFTRQHQVRHSELAALFEQSGATAGEIDLLDAEHTETIGDELESFRTRRNSWSWDVPESLTETCLPRYEAFLRSQFPGSDTMVDRFTYTIQTFRWH
jgi:SAM-dependent methyltransferase